MELNNAIAAMMPAHRTVRAYVPRGRLDDFLALVGARLTGGLAGHDGGADAPGSSASGTSDDSRRR